MAKFKDVDHCVDCSRLIGLKKFRAQNGKCDECAKNYCECGQWLSQFESEELNGQCQGCYNKSVQQKTEDTRHPDDVSPMFSAGR